MEATLYPKKPEGSRVQWPRPIEPTVKPTALAAEARRAHRRLTAIEAEAAALRKERSAAIARLRAEGWSYGRIAALLGVSRSRIAQLS